MNKRVNDLQGRHRDADVENGLVDMGLELGRRGWDELKEWH